MPELCQEYELFYITEFRDGCIYNTESRTKVWIPLNISVPRQLSRTIFQPTMALPVPTNDWITPEEGRWLIEGARD